MAKQVVLERLNKLVAKGYVVRWGELEQDTVRLQHPRAPEPRDQLQGATFFTGVFG